MWMGLKVPKKSPIFLVEGSMGFSLGGYEVMRL